MKFDIGTVVQTLTGRKTVARVKCAWVEHKTTEWQYSLDVPPGMQSTFPESQLKLYERTSNTPKHAAPGNPASNTTSHAAVNVAERSTGGTSGGSDPDPTQGLNLAGSGADPGQKPRGEQAVRGRGKGAEATKELDRKGMG